MRSALMGCLGLTALAAMACGTQATTPREAANSASATPAAQDNSCARRHPAVGAVRLSGARQGSSVALARAGNQTLAYVADADANALQTLDVDAGRAYATTPLVGAPEQVMMLADGRVAVTIRDKNRLQILEPAARYDQPLQPLCTIKTYAEPVGIASTPDDGRLVVTSAWARKVAVYDVDTMTLQLTRDVAREPRSVVVDDDGTRAFVAHVVGGAMSVIDLDAEVRDVRQIDLRIPKQRRRTSGDNLRASCQGYALAKSVSLASFDATKEAEKPPVSLRTTPPPAMPRGRIFAPRVTIDPGETSQRSSGYGGSRQARIESPIVTVVDAAAERPMTTALLRDNNSRNVPKGECLLPRSAAVSAATGSLLVSCLGSDTVVELDPRGTDPSRLERRRWRVPAGPTGIAIDDANHRAVVWSQFDRQLAVINMSAPLASLGVVVTSAPPLKRQRFTEAELLGRKLFHKTDDERIARDGRACASCHPDGREDAITWSTPVGPRQTIMLAGRLKKTAPFSWLGSHKDVKTHLRVTFERLGGTGLHGRGGSIKGKPVASEMDALVSYLHAMPAPNASGALIDPKDAQLAARGKKLFNAREQACASCHSGSRTTDAHGHDMGTQAAGDSKAKFDTPSLRFVGGTAPYFHDGRFATLVDMLMTTNARMGHTMHLSRNDARALAAYMETL